MVDTIEDDTNIAKHNRQSSNSPTPSHSPKINHLPHTLPPLHLQTCTVFSTAELVTLKFPLSAMMDFNELVDTGLCYQNAQILAEDHSFNGCIALVDNSNDFFTSSCGAALLELEPVQGTSETVIDACFPTVDSKRQFRCGGDSICLCDVKQTCTEDSQCESKYCAPTETEGASACVATGLTWKTPGEKMGEYHQLLESAACAGTVSAPIASMHSFVGCVFQSPSTYQTAEEWEATTCGAAIIKLGAVVYPVPYSQCFPVTTTGEVTTAHNNVLCSADLGQECIDDVTVCGGKLQCLDDDDAAHNDLKVLHHVKTCQNDASRMGLVIVAIATILAAVGMF